MDSIKNQEQTHVLLLLWSMKATDRLVTSMDFFLLMKENVSHTWEVRKPVSTIIRLGGTRIFDIYVHVVV